MWHVQSFHSPSRFMLPNEKPEAQRVQTPACAPQLVCARGGIQARACLPHTMMTQPKNEESATESGTFPGEEAETYRLSCPGPRQN